MLLLKWLVAFFKTCFLDQGDPGGTHCYHCLTPLQEINGGLAHHTLKSKATGKTITTCRNCRPYLLNHGYADASTGR